MKISIIGAGRLGGLIAFLVADRGLADEIVLVDINKTGAEGQALDLMHSFLKSGKSAKIQAGEYPAITGSDIVVITAGKPRTATMSSRAELLAENAKIIKSICARVKLHCNDAILITTTNPVDSINYVVWKESGFQRNKIIGFGGLLDSARLASILSEELCVPINSISCDVIGEHGENMVPVFNRLKISGNPAALTPERKEKIRSRLLSIAKEVIEKKGATEYGPASNLVRIIDAVANNKKETLACSCILQGEYGLGGVSLGVPAVIGNKGIEKIEIWPLDSEGRANMKRAGEKILVDTAAALKQ